MTPVLVLCAAILGLGAVMGTPYRQRFLMIGLLWLVAGLGLAVLPHGNGLRQFLGGDLRIWGASSVLAGLGFGYFWVLKRLRARHVMVQVPVQKGKFSTEELDRYARHIMLREIGGPGQRALKQARV